MNGRGYPRKSSVTFRNNGGIYPMIPLKGLSGVPNPARASGADEDLTPIRFAYPVNGSDSLELQLNNGLAEGAFQGRTTIPGIPPGWLAFNTIASILRPGLARNQVGGFMPNFTSPYNQTAMVQATAGSQPVNPGGPGQVAGSVSDVAYEGW
jgi:hypothetical protein